MMDLAALKTAILAEEKNALLFVISQTDTDIMTQDFPEGRCISYHIVPPTRDWLKYRVLLGPSLKADSDKIRDDVATALLGVDPTMLICLNRICIVSDEDDIKSICADMDVGRDKFPDCINIRNPTTLGCIWRSQSSIIINMQATKQVARQLTAIGPDMFEFEQESHKAFWATLFHEIRHLGLNYNPFLPKSEYPDNLRHDCAVDDWAFENYKKLTTRK